MRYPLRPLCACAAVVGLGWAAAQEPPQPRVSEPPPAVSEAAREPSPGGPHAEDLQALNTLVERFTAAYNAGDVSALAELFAEDAEIVDEVGSVTEGREAIAERFATTFEADPGVMIAIEPESVRFLSAETALEKGAATLMAGDRSVPETLRYSVVYVKRDGQWLHAVIRDEAGPEPTHHERLAELEWMVGEWVNESVEAVVSTTCRWTDDGNFLVRHFDVQIEGQVALSGTQRIGWDPLHEQLRTWVFDTEGGFAEGFMARHGNQWLIKATGVRADGQPASATSIVTLLGTDRVAWQVSDRTIGGVAVPDIAQFVMVRKPPKPVE